MRLVWKFRTLCRRSWVHEDTGRHRGVISRTAESVFGALLYLTEKYGRVFPSLEGLAHLSMCCKQSVVTAIADLEALGFVTRIRRIRQIKTALGFRTEQITNAYVVHEPASGLGLLEELTTQQRDNITLLKEKLDLNERQVRAALGILGENDIPPERLAAKLVEIAERFRDLQATASVQPADEP